MTSYDGPYLSRRRHSFFNFCSYWFRWRTANLEKDQNQPLDQKTMKISKCTAYSVAYDLETIMIKLKQLQYFLIMTHNLWAMKKTWHIVIVTLYGYNLSQYYSLLSFIRYSFGSMS